MLVNRLDKTFEENAISLIGQMTGVKACAQGHWSIKCSHGPIKIAGNREEIKIASRYPLTKNATYFTPICHPSEVKGNFRNFIWDEQMFIRHKDKLTNSEHQFPLACMTQQHDTIDENCSPYFPLQKTPQSIFLFGNIIVEPTQHKEKLCFSRISHDSVMFDDTHMLT